jgi:hypothetical protein
MVTITRYILIHSQAGHSAVDAEASNYGFYYVYNIYICQIILAS